MAFYSRGIPDPELIVIAWIKNEDARTVMTHAWGDDLYHYMEYAGPTHARDVLEAIAEHAPSEWVRLTDRLFVRKPMISGLRPREFAGCSSIEFIWGPTSSVSSDTLAFPDERERDRALQRYHSIRFISELEVHGNIRHRKPNAR